jgi:DNA-binding CsgD family transcriptional regulator
VLRARAAHAERLSRPTTWSFRSQRIAGGNKPRRTRPGAKGCRLDSRLAHLLGNCYTRPVKTTRQVPNRVAETVGVGGAGGGGPAGWGAKRDSPGGGEAGSALLAETEWAAAVRALRLSGREFQIVRGVFDCQKESAIAADLAIAPRTVNTHLERLYRKLGVTTRVGLVLRVVRVVHRPVGIATMTSPISTATATAARANTTPSGEYPTVQVPAALLQA